MCAPPLVPDEFDALPSLDYWSFWADSLNGELAWTAHGWLRGHPALPDGYHTTDLLMGFDFEGHRWVESRTGCFYRLLRPIWGPGTMTTFRWPKK